MKCPQYHTQNPDGAKYCFECGNILIKIRSALLKNNKSNRKATRATYAKSILVLLLFICFPGRIAAEELPHIFVITVDTLRRDHVGCYGYHKPTTPNIDALARESCFFKNSFANSSWTLPSYMSFFTGLYPGIHRTVYNKSALPDNITTLVQILKQNGYATGGVVSSRMLGEKFGFGRGFDYYDDFSIAMGKRERLFDGDDDHIPVTESITSEQVTDHAIQWLKRNISHEKPLFLFLHYFDPHPTYLCHRPEISLLEEEYSGTLEGKIQNVQKGLSQDDLEHILALYDSEIRHTDGLIGVFLEFLMENNLFEQSIVLFFADHGEEFLDHDKNFHGHTLYNELIAVPILLKLPYQEKQVAIDYTMSLVDLMPTILDFLKIDRDPLLSGQSLLKAEKIARTLPERQICFETESKGGIKAIIRGQSKIIRNNRKDSFEVYDMEKDFEEKENAFDPSDPHHAWLKEKMNQFWEEIKSLEHVPSAPPLDEKTKEEFKALGYL